MKLALAKHPDRGWLLIPEPWFTVFRDAGAELYEPPADAPAISQPTPVDGPPSALTALEGDGADSQKGAESAPSSPMDSDALTAAEQARLQVAQKEAARRIAEAAARPAPTGPRHGAFITPQHQVGLGKPQRCRTCLELYAPKPTGDRGQCRTCQREARGAA